MSKVLLISAYPTVTQHVVNNWRGQGMHIDAAEHAEDLARFLEQPHTEYTSVLVLSEGMSPQSMKECVAVVRSQSNNVLEHVMALVLMGPEELPNSWTSVLSEAEHEASQSKAIQAVLSEAQGLKQILATGYYNIQIATLSPDELDVKLAILFHYPVPLVPIQFYVASFGFKYGVPADAHWVLDARFIPNPYYNVLLREQTGQDDPVKAFIQAYPSVSLVLGHWQATLRDSLPDYMAQGKREFRVAIGCTGGQHRSVYMAEALVDQLQALYPKAQVVLSHREQNRWPNRVK